MVSSMIRFSIIGCMVQLMDEEWQKRFSVVCSLANTASTFALERDWR
jgi:hypothetical protein